MKLLSFLMLLLFIYVGFMFVIGVGLWDFEGQIQTPKGLAEMPSSIELITTGATGSIVGLGLGALIGRFVLGASALDLAVIALFSALTLGIWNLANTFLTVFNPYLGDIGTYGQYILALGFIILYAIGMIQLRTGGFESAT